ncbi:MAG: hypothetical protein LC623_03165, partial [Halobacteriales archaeon]|nr:hypothetical protein [Halobacteriales archaeon]
MRFPARTASALALCVAALLAAPVGAAQPIGAQLVVNDARFQGMMDQSGSLTFLALSGFAKEVPSHLHAEGGHIEARQFDYDGYEVHGSDLVSGTDVDTLHAVDTYQPVAPDVTAADHARLDLAGVRGDGYQLHILSGTGLSLAGHISDGVQRALQHPRLDQHEINEQDDKGSNLFLPVPVSKEAERGSWTVALAGTSHVLTEAQTATLRLSGTFTLEVVGLDFQLLGQGVEKELRSGVSRSSPAPGGAPTDERAHALHETFLRVLVTDGTLEFNVDAASALQWSGPAVETVAGSVTMEDATGSIQLADGQQQSLTGASYRLDGRYDLKANPAEQGLQLAVTGLDEQGQPLVPQSTTVRQAASPIYWAAVAAVASSAAVAALVVLLLHRRPTMADVESALEAGHFRRAARDAARLLRSRPGFEDAMISRAIALSKLGRNQRVVREIRAHFATREPSDGVLHYVLGLALRETGA